MTRELARELKHASFPVGAYRVGHVFYPPERGGEWSEHSRRHGVTIRPYDLEEHMQDIRDGYYCPDVADLIEACGSASCGCGFPPPYGPPKATSRHY